MCLLCSACTPMHAVYTFTSSTKREYTVHLEEKKEGGLICNIATMLLKFKVLLGEKGITSVET